MIIDIDDTKFHLRVFLCGVEIHHAERAFFVESHDPLGPLGIFHKPVGMDVGEFGAHYLVEVVPFGSFDFTEVGSVAVGSHEDDTIYLLVFDKGEDFLSFIGESIPGVFASWFYPWRPWDGGDQHLEFPFG